MLKDITIGQYYEGNSFVHQLDPRSKITAIFFFMVGLFMAKTFLTFFCAYTISFAMLLISRVPMKLYLKGLKPLWFIIVFTALMQILFIKDGTMLFEWHFLKITDQGLILAFFMCSRLILLVLVTSILTLTTTPITLTNGIESMLKPFEKIGVPAHELAMMMSIALRFVPTLIDETDKIIKAQSARGADFESGNVMSRAKALLPILVPLFISALKRADELALAMEARCYRGGEGRTKLKALVFAKKDYLTMVLSFFVLVGMTTLWSLGL